MKATTVIFLSFILLACSLPSQIYWDKKISELCSKNSTVTIYEKETLSKDEYNALPIVAGFISVPVMELSKENQKYFSEVKRTVIHKSNPSVYRSDVYIKRRLDDKIIAQYALFMRSGGDFLVIDHPSSCACPDPQEIRRQISEIFSIKSD